MKKLSNKFFLFFFITVLAFAGCNLKEGKEAIPEKSEITENASIKDSSTEINENIENSKPRPLQFNHYNYSDICEIIIDDEGKIYTHPWYHSESKKEIFLEIDKNGYLKLKNDEYDLFFIDGEEYFIDEKIESDKFNDLLGNVSFNGRMIENIKASSTLTDKYHTYSPDGTLSAWYTGDCDSWGFVKDNIPWVEGKEDYGIGESISFEFDKEVSAFNIINGYVDPYNLSLFKNNSYSGWTISILNGYVNPEKPHLYKENSRLKSATLIVDDKKEIKIQFNDYFEITNVKISGEVKKIKLIIDDVYKGTKYKDTCITGISAYPL